MTNSTEKKRESNLELLRIVTMLIIVVHHYVVNSGLTDVIANENIMTAKSVVALVAGWGGKTGINCFVLISGYFMCKSTISLRKFLKLLLEIMFYKIVIWMIFFVTGYETFSIKGMIKAFLPIYGIGEGFSSSYLIFFLFIPFLNILINGMNEKLHRYLLVLCLIVYTGFPTFFMAGVKLSYVSWFMVLYIMASYVRLYPKRIFESTKMWGSLAGVLILISWCSVIIGAYVGKLINRSIYYYFVADSNKVLAVVTAFCIFMFFKNVKVPYSRFINIIAASTFGVLMIHANSDTMRRWLWKDILNNVGWYESDWFYFHMFVSVIGIYVVCTLIDMVRIAFIEKPFFAYYDKLAKRIEKKDLV